MRAAKQTQTTKLTPVEAPMGKRINALVAKRNKIRVLDAKVSALKEELHEEEMAVRRDLVKQGLDNARGTKATVSVTSREVCKIEDYKKFETYVYRNKALDLLQLRPSITAVRERQKAGKTVSGISVEHIPTLSIRARS